MEENRRRTGPGARFAAITVNLRVAVVTVVAIAFLAGGCAGRYAGPRTLAGIGTLGVIGGGITWAAGEGASADRGRAPIEAGFLSVAVGLAAIAIAGGWMAASVGCKADPDCDEEEQCREIPAPPGGIPYKQCMPR
jgi:hypothetical protein